MNKFTVVPVLAALLAGCAAGPQFKRPEPPAVGRYTAETLQLEAPATAGDSAQHAILGGQPVAEWWKLFGSDAVNDVVTRSLAGNRTLAAAAATLAQAQEVAAAQAGTAAPQVGVTAGVGRQKYGAEFLGTLPKPPPFTYFAIGPTVSYALDYTGGVARSIEQQFALAEYQHQQMNAATLAVTGNAVMQLLRVAALQAQVATAESILEQDRENLKLVQEAFDAGSVSRLDIVSAESQLSGDATQIPSFRQELSVARHALAIAMGQPPASAALPAIELTQLILPRQIPVSLPSELAHRRPDILAAEAQLHAATAALGVATANLYPHINLTANAGQQATQFGHLFDRTSSVFGIAGALVEPIFDGGTLRAERRAAENAMHASAANYEQTVLMAFGQVADTLDALEHDAQQLDAQAHAESSAKESLDLTRLSYHEGNVGVLQVLDAERLYQRARLGYVRAQSQQYLDTAQLFLALGGAGPEAEAPAEVVARPPQTATRP